jgi:CRISPR-associated protein Cas2
MLTLISYDIVDTKRRTKVMQLLKGYGRPVQRSVFECPLSGQELIALAAELTAIIDGTTDSVRCYPLDAAAVGRIVIQGVGEVAAEPTHYLV